MSCIPYLKGDSPIHRLDPRIRAAAALLFAIMVAFLTEIPLLLTAVALAGCLLVASLIKPSFYINRIISLNIFLSVLFLFLPISTPGESAFSIAPLNWSWPGILLAKRITLRANAIVIFYTAAISTMQPVTLGHALYRLKFPEILVHQFLFTIRYVKVLREELDRLRNAMRIRAFKPRLNSHTFRSYGYLLGMLLVKSFERSERIYQAMKCRGFAGNFYLLDEFQFAGKDLIFFALTLSSLFTLGVFQWLI
jgi:cobalt/nickel transport system permease protein